MAIPFSGRTADVAVRAPWPVGGGGQALAGTI